MIEFNDKDKYCRWNGTLMSPENHKKLFGIDKELVCLTKNLIIYDTTYYTDMPLDKLLLKIGTHYKTDAQRKEVCSMDAGWHDSIWERCLKDKVAIPYSAIKGMKVKPICEFRNDFPYFDNKAYTKFYKELDEYFADMPKAGVYMTPEDYPKTIDECKGDKEPFPEKFMKVIDLEEVKKKEPVATFKCLNGHLCPVDEAAEEYGKRQGVEDKPFAIRHFKAGAKWMAEQGVVTEQVVGRTPLNGPNGVTVFLHDFDGIKAGDKVIVQVRKK